MGVDYSGGVTITYKDLKITVQVKDGGGSISTNFERVKKPSLEEFFTGIPEDKQECYCDNCNWEGRREALGKEVIDIHKLWERITPGYETPVGECPDCGALCYLYAVKNYKIALEAANEHNGAVDGVEAMILAHACAGMAIGTDKYLNGVDIALEAIGNHFSG